MRSSAWLLTVIAASDAISRSFANFEKSAKSSQIAGMDSDGIDRSFLVKRAGIFFACNDKSLIAACAISALNVASGFVIATSCLKAVFNTPMPSMRSLTTPVAPLCASAVVDRTKKAGIISLFFMCSYLVVAGERSSCDL